MLRVCGITFTHSPNYGSCLQTYALQHVIESLTIGGEKCSYSVIPIQTLKDFPTIGLSAHIVKPLLAWNRLQYQSFYNKYLHFAKCRYIRDLSELNQQYDAFVCGSDVIWSNNFNNGVGAYFLDFAEKYRFSYAASFGKSSIPDSFLRFAAPKIDQLNAISVREPSGVQIARQCTQKPIKVVSDPVLLVDASVWKGIAVKKPHKQPYILIYVTHLNDTIKDFLAKLTAVTGLPAVWAVAGPKQALMRGMLQVHKPAEWLGLLEGAEYIVTNSFHATAFSTLFHKKFFTVVYGEKDKGINVRMNDFLNTVGLGSRIHSAVPETIDLSEIDFSEADQRVDELRKDSMAFLRENLEAAYREKLELEKKEHH